MIGKSVAHYTITKKIGKGGMGDVYRARDTMLDRDVALKILPDSFARDPQHKARFQREAKLLASLKHPNIAVVHGLESNGGTHAIAMELVEGETLADRIGKGAIPLEEALKIAVQIAEALEAAHEMGVVHRDLKPANVMITEDDGNVKVLDFGLAKAVDSKPATDANSSQSPTLTLEATQSGIILGTASYMSPEQARGKAVDKRTDIWAFGCLLFEMLSGRQAFRGDDLSLTLAAVMKDDPPWGCMPDLPERLRDLAERCLRKDPRLRIRDIGDVRVPMREMLEDGFDRAPVYPGRRVAAGALLAVGTLALLAGAAVGYLAGDRSGPTETFAIESFSRLTSERGFNAFAKFSHDGARVISSQASSGADFRLIEVGIDGPGSRELDIPGYYVVDVSASDELAIVRPDRHGEQLWYRSGTLARVPLVGGVPREVAEDVSFAAWSPDGQLAAIRMVDAISRLEYPIGKVLYQTSDVLDELAFSPDGTRLAFWEGVFGGRTMAVSTIDLEGNKTTLSSGWFDWYGLVWTPDSREIWFGAARTGNSTSLFAVDLEGNQRQLWSFPGLFQVADLSSRGDLLLGDMQHQNIMIGRPPGSRQEYSWLELSYPVDLSDDGQWVLLRELGSTSGAVYLRKTDGSPPVRLGQGIPLSLSPDGKWVIAKLQQVPPRLFAIPTGAGLERQFDVGSLEQIDAAVWFPDGDSILLNGREPGQPSRFFVLNLADGSLSVLPPRGVTFHDTRYVTALSQGKIISPDGRWAVGWQPGSGLQLFSTRGESPRPLPSSISDDIPLRWSRDGRFLFSFKLGQIPARVLKTDIETGSQEVWLEFAPEDLAGVSSISAIYLDAKAESYVYKYSRILSDLYLARVKK